MTVAGPVRRRKEALRERGASPRAQADALLAWYDRHRRDLPWRARPGEPADPYRVWLSEIMLQQTTVKTVAAYYERFLERFPSIEALAAASLEDVLKAWAGLGYYGRARNLHACAREVMRQHGGRLPEDEEALRRLPGIGSYTAAAIAAIAFGRRASPVDGNVERVVARLFAVEEPLPRARGMIRRLAEALMPASRPGDFAQALMDLGATLCTPIRPACGVCPWMEACAARRQGCPEAFPRRVARAQGRLRRGAVFFVLREDDAVLVRSRPPEGLLGSMTEFPTTEWTPGFDETGALAHAPQFPHAPQWRRLSGVVTHTFTHFPLELFVYAAGVAAATPAPQGMRWVAVSDLDGEALPTVMRKVVRLATGQFSKKRGCIPGCFT
jgi:A/G-specific adenine glycosylase